MDNVKSIVEQRRAKIVSEYYDKILSMFDNVDCVSIAETDRIPVHADSYVIYVPEVHRKALIALLINKGFTIRNNPSFPASYIIFYITIEEQ